MLSVALQVPRDDEKTPVCIIDDEQLDQVLNTCRVNVLDPNFRTRIDGEVDGISGMHTKNACLSRYEFDL